MTVQVASRGPVRTAERAPGPDLARGFMLMLIALANTAWYLWALESGTTIIHPVEGSAFDRVVQAVLIIAVDMRVYPMFAFLFGYGLVQIYRRQAEAGATDRSARRVLRRRNLWLLLFGLVHAGLLWMGDVLGAYGLAGLIMVAIFFRRRDKTLRIWATVLIGLACLVTLMSIVGAVFVAGQPAPATATPNFWELSRASLADPSYVSSLVNRLLFWPALVIAQGLVTGVIPIVLLLAFWAARKHVLERPGEHLRLLRRTAITGIAIGWAGGVPHALYHVGLIPVPDHAAWVFNSTQPITGLFAGVGYVALFGLIGHHVAARPAPSGLTGVVTAVGRRSLSCYLAQSVICAPLLSAWGLGLGARMGSATMAGLAIAVWAVIAVGAWLLERQQRPGPAEWLLRRLIYGPRTT